MNIIPSIVASLTILSLAPVSLGAEKVIDAAVLPFVQIPSTGATLDVTFSDATEPATGFAIDAPWVALVADSGGGVFPWSLDLSVTITLPDGSVVVWGPDIFGETSIASYPMQDGASLFPGDTSAGTYGLAFDSGAPSPWVASLSAGMCYLTTTVPDVTFTETVTPDPAQMWNRPFAIGSISGLGPVAYHAMEFTVETSGVYDFSSVLSPTNDHFTFLYEGSFEPIFPLANLLDYGLGNGFSPFDVPEGTSSFGALLFEGETYVWVTSQWASFSQINPSVNTIVGPGAVLPVGTEPCAGDCDASGAVDFADLVAMLSLFGTGEAGACDADSSGSVDFADLVAALGVFGPCP